MSDESNYIVRNPRLILGYLDDLIQKKCLIAAFFGVNNSSFLTTIVELDKKNKLLLLDSAPTSALDDELLTSEKTFFRTDYEGIKVSFKGDAIRKIKRGHSWTLAMPIPSSIYWMQRRQYYRVKVPLFHRGSYFRPSQFDDSDAISLPLIDLSISGVALLNTAIDAEWATKLIPGHQWIDGCLHLESGASCLVTLNVVYINEIRANTIQMHQRIGCYFEQLPAHFDSLLQRYMQEVELLHKNIA